MAEDIIYRTYAKEIPKTFKAITESFCNKPRGGLYGCRNDEWLQWCKAEDFPCAKTYFEWKLKEGAKVYYIDHVNSFLHLVEKYPSITGDSDSDVEKMLVNSGQGNLTYTSIDYKKLWKDGYDAVEVTDDVNTNLHLGLSFYLGEDGANFSLLSARLLKDKQYLCLLETAVNAWDVPSINVFDPQNTVEIIGGLKS